MNGKMNAKLENSNPLLLLIHHLSKKPLNLLISITNLLMPLSNMSMEKPKFSEISEPSLTRLKKDSKFTMLIKLYSNSLKNISLMENPIMEKCKFGIELKINQELQLFHFSLMKMMMLRMNSLNNLPQPYGPLLLLLTLAYPQFLLTLPIILD